MGMAFVSTFYMVYYYFLCHVYLIFYATPESSFTFDVCSLPVSRNIIEGFFNLYSGTWLSEITALLLIPYPVFSN